MPRAALHVPEIAAIVGSYGDAAWRLVEAGLDGVELVATDGYLHASC